jgi:hypothetical protein
VPPYFGASGFTVAVGVGSAVAVAVAVDVGPDVVVVAAVVCPAVVVAAGLVAAGEPQPTKIRISISAITIVTIFFNFYLPDLMC